MGIIKEVNLPIKWLGDRPIVLTGASGLLGSYFCQYFKNCKTLVPVSHTHCVSGFPSAQNIDLRDRDNTFRLLETIRPRLIIHAAAETNVEKCERDPPSAVCTNVDVTSHLLEWVTHQDLDTTFVYISTDQLYYGPGPHNERYIYPRNVYALTKHTAESLVRRCPNHLILRVNFVGWSSRRAGFVNWLVERLQQDEPLTLVDDVMFSPLSASDLVEIVLQLISRQVQGTYNVGATGAGCSKAEFGLRLGSELGLNLSAVHIGKIYELGFRAMRPTDMTMDVGAVEAELGYFLPTMEETVTQLVSEFKAKRLPIGS